MRLVGRIVKWLGIALVALVVAIAGWLWVAPPDLIRVGAGYSAKIVCSNVFLAGRTGGEVLAVDVQAPGHPLLRLMDVDVDRAGGTVTASLLGLFAPMTAVVRPGTGCAVAGDGDVEGVRRFTAAPGAVLRNSSDAWPAGDRVALDMDPALAAILDDDALAGPGMRAIVVVKNGAIVGERYGAGFTAATPLLGWSMTKTVTAALIGTLVGEGRLDVNEPAGLPGWDDERAAITIADLMAMSSGLVFNEDYGDVTDVTRMLYLEPDMAGFAADKPLEGAIGATFSYSSGTTVLLSRIWQDRFASVGEAMAWPRQALFGPLGMESAVLEADAEGTYVGSSYLYATPRDWMRFALFLLEDGVWQGERILPEGFVEWMREPAPASDGVYGRGQLWLQGPQVREESGEADALPDDTFWLRGHDGQAIAIVPSERLIVLRMGLTPSSRGYTPEPLVRKVIGALADQQ
jgi:CubicO group peptidase (beta-lactamase class C family)